MIRSRIPLTAIVVAAAVALSTTPLAQVRPEVALRAAIELEEGKGDIKGAIEQYKKLADGRDRAVGAEALLRLAQAYQKLGDADARGVYERLVRDFSDQRDAAAQARVRLQALGAGTGNNQTSRRIVPVWTGEGVTYGMPSADGRYIAFNPGTGDLAIRDIVTGTTRRLTNKGDWAASGDYASEAIVSPDNRSVAYTWYVEADGTSELRLLSLQKDAAPRTLLRAQDRYVVPHAWTPDGTRLIVSRRVLETRQLGVLTVGDGRYEPLKSFEWRTQIGGVSVSPDGRYVSYSLPAGSPPNRDILILSLDGSAEIPALAGPEDDFNPLWSPDGGYLVFMRADTGGRSLWVVRTDNGKVTGTPTLVRPDVGRMNPLGITRSGALYYGLTGAQRQGIYVAQLDKSVATTSAPIASQPFDGRTGPAFTPDGERITYWTAEGVALRSIRTGQVRTVALPSGTNNLFTSPKWFPDGRSLLIVRIEGNISALSRFDIETGDVERLHQLDGGFPTSYAVAPDGTAVYWTVDATQAGSNAPPNGRLVRFDLKTREVQELKRDGWFLAIAISPDGKELAYLRNDRSDRSKNEAPGFLEVIPSRGGESRQVFREPVWTGPSRINTLAWSPDQQSLVAVRDDGILWRIPLSGGAPQNMGISATKYQFGAGQSQSTTPAERRIKSPAIHPDGRTLAFALAEVQGREIWSLENFLPAARTRK
jgi:Tol biopolymer transport system component